MWKEHFKLMADGQIPIQNKMYTTAQTGGQDVNLMSTTEAIVEQARSDLKRTLSERDVYQPKKVKLTVQSGGGQSSGKKKRKTKKRTTSSTSTSARGRKRKKSSTSKKKRSRTGKTKKGKRKSKKKSKKKSTTKSKK